MSIATIAINDRAVQRAVTLGLEGLGLPSPGDNVEVQAQWEHQSSVQRDLVVRVRYTRCFAKRPSQKLFPVTEHRLEGASLRANSELAEFFEQVPFESLVMLHAELRKHGFKWPSGWPMLDYNLRKGLERDYLLGRRGGLAQAALPRPMSGLGTMTGDVH